MAKAIKILIIPHGEKSRGRLLWVWGSSPMTSSKVPVSLCCSALQLLMAGLPPRAILDGAVLGTTPVLRAENWQKAGRQRQSHEDVLPGK